MEDKTDNLAVGPELERVSSVHQVDTDLKASVADNIHQEHSELYLEAIRRYPVDESIDQEAEKRLKRKLDMRLLPLLGICYFFYVREQTFTFTPFRSQLIPSSMLIRQHSPTRPSSASRTACICMARSTPGCRVSSISDGCSGQSHLTSSCSGASLPGTLPSTSSCGVYFSCARPHRRTSALLLHFGSFLARLRPLRTRRSCSSSPHTTPVPSNLGASRRTTYGMASAWPAAV